MNIISKKIPLITFILGYLLASVFLLSSMAMMASPAHASQYSDGIYCGYNFEDMNRSQRRGYEASEKSAEHKECMRKAKEALNQDAQNKAAEEKKKLEELQVDYSATECEPGDSDCCNGVKTSISYNCTASSSGGNIGGNPIFGLLLAAVNFLAIGVGVAVVGGIVYGGIKYASAGGNSGQVEESKKIITNSIIALVMFALMYAFINFLVPGGVFT